MPREPFSFDLDKSQFQNQLDRRAVEELAVSKWREFLRSLRRMAVAAGQASLSEYEVAMDVLCPRYTVSIFAARFALFCAKYPRNPNVQPIVNLTHRWLRPKNSFGTFSGFSWIYHRNASNVEFHFNTKLLDMSQQLDRKKASLLIIHEAGHLQTAWPFMMSSSGAGYARNSSPEHEMQAWWFSAAVLELIVGAFGRDNRSSKTPPGTDDLTIHALLGDLMVATP